MGLISKKISEGYPLELINRKYLANIVKKMIGCDSIESLLKLKNFQESKIDFLHQRWLSYYFPRCYYKRLGNNLNFIGEWKRKKPNNYVDVLDHNKDE